MWGLDFSGAQLTLAADLLKPYAPQLHLFQSAMEVNPGLPANHFDLVLSVYGLGWTADLEGTLALIASYTCTTVHPNAFKALGQVCV